MNFISSYQDRGMFLSISSAVDNIDRLFELFGKRVGKRRFVQITKSAIKCLILLGMGK